MSSRLLPLVLMLVSSVALAQASEMPISLTASDGTGLKLIGLQANAVVSGPLAFTELKLTFQNPLDRVIEGQFRITLPQRAVVSRFAMKLESRWQEGEVVEKQAARRAYEDFLHRRQDPALLEQAAGNEFSARVFPIPARGEKELIISYSQQLVSSRTPYVLPLKGLPQISKLAVDVSGGSSPVHLEKTSYVPNEDVRVQAQEKTTALRSANMAVVRVRPVSAESPPEAIGSLLILFDTSASRALGFGAQVSLVQGLMKKLPAKTPVTLIAFDQDFERIFEGSADSFSETHVKALKGRRALGATNLMSVIDAAAKQKRERVVLISDGVATAYEDAPELLAKSVKALGAAGVRRFDTIAVGGIRDESLLHQLVTAGLSSDGAVIDADEGVDAVMRRLQSVVRSKVPVVVSGATFQWPKTLDAMQAGDEALVFAEIPSGAKLAVAVAGKAVDVSALGEVSPPMLERSVVQARIEALTDELNRVADGPRQKEAVKEKIIALSVKHRVLSPYTALLVLETEQDYARFKIDRRALVDILTVEKGVVRLLHRSEESVAVAPKPPPTPAKPEPSLLKKLSATVAGAVSAANEEPAAVEADSLAERKPDDAELALEEEASKAAEAAPPPPAPRPAAAMAPPAAAAPVRAPPRESRRAEYGSALRDDRGSGPQKGPPPYTGALKDVMDLISAGKKADALSKALGWREESPGDVLALIALGEAAEALNDVGLAARAYGSIIDLFPARADLRRFAGVRLERLSSGLELAADSFEHSVEQRPDHPQSHRLLAYALVKRGEPQKAFQVLVAARAREYPSGRFAETQKILSEDLGLVAAAWIKKEPARKQEIRTQLKAANGTQESAPSIRFVLNWETDANDVDFHIYDARGGHAYYSSKELQSGGSLYADVTTGYGPECFTIRAPQAKRAGPYVLQAHYYSRGPMGYGLGKLQIIEHDGAGTLRFEERPFIVMVDSAFVDLGSVR